MRAETLDKILRDLTALDRLHRVQDLVREMPELPQSLRIASDEAERAPPKSVPLEEFVQPSIVTQAVQYVSKAADAAVHYVAIAKDYAVRLYNGAKDFFYVHVPSWVKVHRASFNEFGSGLYGLTTPATGDVHIRDDLHGDEFAEVLLHEVAHNLYPTLSEMQIRSHVRSILGTRAVIHSRL